MEVEDAEIGQRRRVRETLQHTVEVACVSQILQTQRRPLAARHRARLPSDEERWQKGRSSHVWCTSRLSGPTRGGSTQKGSIARPCNRQDIPAHALRRCFTHPPAPPPPPLAHMHRPPNPRSRPCSRPSNPILISPSFSSRLPHLRSNLPNSNCTKPKQQPPPSINHLLPRTPTQKRPKPGQPKLTNAPNSQTQRNPTSKQTPQRGRKPEQPPNREKRSGRTTNRALMTASRGVQSLTHARGQTRT
jgi:hypothetical protein